MLVKNFHSLVKYWKNCLHEILLVGARLQIFPVTINLSFSFCTFLFGETILNSFNFEVSVFLSDFNLLDVVVNFENSSMWLSLDNIFVNELVIRHNFLGNDISNIHDAVFTLIGIVVEENVMSTVVGLINKKWLSSFTVEVI